MSTASPSHRLSAGVAAVSAATLILGLALASPVHAAPETTVADQKVNSERPSKSTDRFIVRFEGASKTAPAERSKAYSETAEETGISVKEVKTTTSGDAVVSASRSLSPDEYDEFLQNIESQPNVAYAEPDTLMRPSSMPNDELSYEQWNLYDSKAGLQLPTVWDKTKGAGQVVAVIDTGITAHSDLNANVLPGYDMISDARISRDGNGRDASANDEGDYTNAGDCGYVESYESSWHGTHVAGIIAAVANNGQGIAGVAPGAKVLPVRAMGACGGYTSDIADSIIWASGGTVTGTPVNPTPAKVINLSLGVETPCSTTTQAAIDSAVSRGSSVFVAAGNSSVNAATTSPANCNNVITVAASTREGAKASYSNYGTTVDVSAPGGEGWDAIVSTYNYGTSTPSEEAYAWLQGTSMAAPHAAGVGALMLAANPSLTPAALEQRLKATARPLAVACPEGCGAGLINPLTAVALPEPVAGMVSAVPKITGTAQVGAKLTAAPGTWGPAPVTLAYQWKRAGVAIAGATASTYAVSDADLGKPLTVTVTGSKTNYKSVSTTSSATPAVTAGTLQSSVPTITGTAKVGYTLTANTGTWTTGTTLKYQWYRSGVAVAGATARTFALSAADHGKRMSVRVSGSKTAYVTKNVTSAQTAIVAIGTLKSSVPTISGTARSGYTLTAKAGTWTTGTTLKYQWYRSGVAITGATGVSYKLVTADRYDTIKVRVVGSKAGYTTATTYSASTVKVP
jgi:serine protease